MTGERQQERPRRRRHRRGPRPGQRLGRILSTAGGEERRPGARLLVVSPPTPAVVGPHAVHLHTCDGLPAMAAPDDGRWARCPRGRDACDGRRHQISGPGAPAKLSVCLGDGALRRLQHEKQSAGWARPLNRVGAAFAFRGWLTVLDGACMPPQHLGIELQANRADGARRLTLAHSAAAPAGTGARD